MTLIVKYLDPRLPDRFWDRTRCDESGCWLWLGAIRKDGYGSFTVRSYKTALSHRHSYLKLVGDIQPGLQLDHLCRVRSCVNPSHLEPVTQAENLRRGLLGVLKTHCKSGHPFDEANTYQWTSANGSSNRRIKATQRRACDRAGS